MSCERYFGFGCEIDEETSNKLEGILFVSLLKACVVIASLSLCATQIGSCLA